MPVKFGFGGPNNPMVNVTVIQPLKIYRAIIAFDKSFHRQTLLHYDATSDRSVPCLHEECKRCPAPTRPVTYVPAWLMKGATARFQQTILMVTTAWSGILDHDLDKWVYSLKREREDKNSPVTWALDKAIANDMHPLRGFDIEASLWRMWGMSRPTSDVTLADRQV